VTILARRAARIMFAIAAVAAVSVAFVQALDEAEGIPFPSASRTVVAGGVLLIGMFLTAITWSMLTARSFRRLAPGYFVAQLGKYIPGSVWQGVGQVMDAVRIGLRRGTAVIAYLVQIGTQVVAGGVVAGLLLASRPGGWILAAALASPLSVLLLYRGWMSGLFQQLARVAPTRFGRLPMTLPPQRRILLAAALGIATMTCMSLGYALLLPSPASDLRPLIVAAGAFALAWVVGFLVVPLPAGLGVREFMLVATLGDAHGTAAVLAAAILHRLLLIVVEAGLAAAAQLVRRFDSEVGTPGAANGRQV
jgi:glycosyltransferase 2 family protein